MEALGGVGGPPAAATSGTPGIDVGAAINGALGGLVAAAQVLLGTVLIAAGILLVASTTSAGRAAGGAAVGGAKAGARFIPVVGGFVR